MQLVIFSGITGFEKSEFIKVFTRKSLEKQGFNSEINDDDSKQFIHYIKFEDELLEVDDSINIARFLAKPSLHEKIQSIERTYNRIGEQIRSINAQHVFLDIHLSYCYRSQFIPPIYPANLRQLDRGEEAVIKVISLVDDVFVIWYNIHRKEVEYPQTGLRLREILAWRSVELLQAEAVRYQFTTQDRSVNNYLVAVRHPFETFYNLVFRENPLGIYLSFPITNTRHFPKRIQNINDFRKKMYNLSSKLGVTVFDPVTIDELALNHAETEGDYRVVHANGRWPLEIETLVNEPEWPISIPEVEVVEAEQDILNNVRVRDYKLIDNSVFTVVYRKNYGGPSTGVIEEIRYANYRGRRVYVYDPIEDTETGAPHPFDQDEIGSRELDVFYNDIENGIKTHEKQRS